MSATDTKSPTTTAVDVKSYDLSTFRLKQILNNNTKSKTIVVLGTFPSTADDDNNQAIIVFEKTAFTASNVNTNVDDNDVIVSANIDIDDDNQTSNKTSNGDNSENNQSTFFTSDTRLKLEFLNDIYGNFECFPKPEINSNFSSFIIHINTYSFKFQKKNRIFFIGESNDDDLTLKYFLFFFFSQYRRY